jgi:hypothetical protein
LDSDCLKRRILSLTHNPGQLIPAGKAALQAARAYSWSQYRKRVVALLREAYAASRAGSAARPPLYGAA